MVKKILGPIFAVIGKIGLIGAIAVAAYLSFSGNCPFVGKGRINLLWFVLIVVACNYIAEFGDKLCDGGYGSGGFLAVKVKFYSVIYFITMKLLRIVFWIVLISFGFMTLGVIMSIFVDITEYFGAEAVGLFFGAWATLGLYVTIVGNVETYNLHHCKRCGASLKGCGYEYEEQERSYSVDSNNNLKRNSKIRFEVDCEACGHENIWYHTMSTNAEAVEKYIRGIVGRK